MEAVAQPQSPVQDAANARVNVEILGERYTIRGEAEPGYIAEVARMVDDRMRELRQGMRSINRSRLAVLTAINIADELLQARMAPPAGEGSEAAIQQVRQRTSQLISLLDEGLVGDSLAEI